MKAIPQARAAANVVAFDGRIHVIGGRIGLTDTAHHDVYDSSTNLWGTAANMITARADPAYAVVGNKLHVAGGRPGQMQSHEVYDFAIDTLTEAAPLASARA